MYLVSKNWKGKYIQTWHGETCRVDNPPKRTYSHIPNIHSIKYLILYLNWCQMRPSQPQSNQIHPSLLYTAFIPIPLTRVLWRSTCNMTQVSHEPKLLENKLRVAFKSAFVITQYWKIFSQFNLSQSLSIPYSWKPYLSAYPDSPLIMYIKYQIIYWFDRTPIAHLLLSFLQPFLVPEMLTDMTTLTQPSNDKVPGVLVDFKLGGSPES